MTDYAAVYEATARAARVWAWRAGAQTHDEIEDLVGAAWLLLLEAAPVLQSPAHGAAYLHRCVRTAVRTLVRQIRRERLASLNDNLAAPVVAEPVEVAVWGAAELLPGWADCTPRERLALVLGAAGWATAEIAATAPRLYPNPNTVAKAAWRARRRIIAAHQEAR